MDREKDSSKRCGDPVEPLQKLVRFDTTNPPGNESECIAFIFAETIHAADERIPVEAVHFGTDAIYQVLQRFDT